jgi:hypothetical protein
MAKVQVRVLMQIKMTATNEDICIQVNIERQRFTVVKL